MPNWCDNTTCFVGKKEDLKRFMDIFKPDDSSPKMGNVYPTDKTYESNTDTWGCKWDLKDVSLIDQTNQMALFSYWTPWGPPCEFLNKVRNDYNLSIVSYAIEPGMDLFKKITYFNWGTHYKNFDNLEDIEYELELGVGYDGITDSFGLR